MHPADRSAVAERFDRAKREVIAYVEALVGVVNATPRPADGVALEGHTLLSVPTDDLERFLAWADSMCDEDGDGRFTSINDLCELSLERNYDDDDAIVEAKAVKRVIDSIRERVAK